MPYDVTKYEPQYGGMINSSGNVKNLADAIDSSGKLMVAGSFSSTPSGTQTVNNDVIATTMQNAATATGNGTTLNTANQAIAVLDVQGTFVGTITVEGTIDGTTYFTVTTTSISAETRQTTITAAGQYSLRVAGLQNIRARISAYTSGSITVYGRAVAGGVSHHTAAITNTPTFNQGGVDQTQALKSYTFQTSATAIGNGTVGDVSGYSTLMVKISQTGTSAVIFEESIDNVTWNTMAGYSPTGGYQISLNSASADLRFNVSAFKYVRFRISSYTSGSIDVTGYAATGSMPVYNGSISNSFSNNDANTATAYSQLTSSYLLGFNGASWDRIQVDANKNLKVNVSQVIIPSSDGLSAGGVTSSFPSFSHYWNGGGWDRARNNIVGTILSSAARTSTTTSNDFTNYNHRGIILFLNVTVASGTGGLQVGLQFKDTVSGTYRTIGNLPTAVIATGCTVLIFYPSVDALNSSVSLHQSILLPQIFRISVNHGDASSYTYSVGYQMIL